MSAIFRAISRELAMHSGNIMFNALNSEHAVLIFIDMSLINNFCILI